jgi:type IX secretion system PorP/SprF family membrane protein
MKKLYFLLIAFFFASGAFAQDVHLSQFYNQPVMLNPALTGFTPGKARINISYRNQWFSATHDGLFRPPYMTTALGAELPISIKRDVLGVGLLIANDQAGANTFTTVITQASVAYIKTLGRDENHRLSAGFQIGYTYQSIKTVDFQFYNQFDQTNQFQSTMSSNEDLSKTKVGYLNLNFGLVWYGKLSDHFGMYLGGSFYNVTTPKYNILPNQKRDLYWRANVHTGLDIKIGDKSHILPSIMYMQQGVNNQLNTGLGFGYDLNDDMALTIGCYNRVNPHKKINNWIGTNGDAVIPYAAFEIKGFKIGITYDATISKLKQSGSGVGSFELMLGYTIRGRDYDDRNSLVTPRF